MSYRDNCDVQQQSTSSSSNGHDHSNGPSSSSNSLPVDIHSWEYRMERYWAGLGCPEIPFPGVHYVHDDPDEEWYPDLGPVDQDQDRQSQRSDNVDSDDVSASSDSSLGSRPRVRTSSIYIMRIDGVITGVANGAVPAPPNDDEFLADLIRRRQVEGVEGNQDQNNHNDDDDDGHENDDDDDIRTDITGDSIRTLMMSTAVPSECDPDVVSSSGDESFDLASTTLGNTCDESGVECVEEGSGSTHSTVTSGESGGCFDYALCCVKRRRLG